MQTTFRMCANNVKEMHRPGSEFAVSRAVSVSGRVTATETLRADWELITAMGFFGVGPGLLVASTTDPHLAILVASLVRASGQGWGAQPPDFFVLGCQT